jgi:hypothetical protein
MCRLWEGTMRSSWKCMFWVLDAGLESIDGVQHEAGA